MWKGLRTCEILASDLAAAKRWYAEVLGIAPYFDQPFYVGFDVGGYELALQPAAEADARGVTAYWGVTDLEGALRHLLSRGATGVVPVTDVGGGIRVAKVRDPFGNPIGLIDNPEFAPPLVAARAGDRSDLVIVREVELPIPPSEVWPLWSSSEGFARWWIPGARIDLRPGGHFEFYFLKDNPPGLRGSEGCRVLSFLPERMLSFTWNAPPHLRTRDQHTWVVVELLATGAGTRVRISHLGWPAGGLAAAGSDWPETVRYFEAAWGHVLDALKEHAESKGSR